MFSFSTSQAALFDCHFFSTGTKVSPGPKVSSTFKQRVEISLENKYLGMAHFLAVTLMHISFYVLPFALYCHWQSWLGSWCSPRNPWSIRCDSIPGSSRIMCRQKEGVSPDAACRQWARQSLVQQLVLSCSCRDSEAWCCCCCCFHGGADIDARPDSLGRSRKSENAAAAEWIPTSVSHTNAHSLSHKSTLPVRLTHSLRIPLNQPLLPSPAARVHQVFISVSRSYGPNLPVY